MVKHTQTIRRQFAGELFECVWPFWGIGAERVKNNLLTITISSCRRNGCLRLFEKKSWTEYMFTRISWKTSEQLLRNQFQSIPRFHVHSILKLFWGIFKSFQCGTTSTNFCYLWQIKALKLRRVELMEVIIESNLDISKKAAVKLSSVFGNGNFF